MKNGSHELSSTQQLEPPRVKVMRMRMGMRMRMRMRTSSARPSSSTQLPPHLAVPAKGQAHFCSLYPPPLPSILTKPCSNTHRRFALLQSTLAVDFGMRKV